jgi:phosphatidylinositol-3,4,5-trisphosphate 3-phosphatase/dual-specificity protein phosphatase PTEN
LKLKHGDNYKVYNMSGRQYDFAKFDNRVETYQWEDHHSPALSILFEACHSMYSFLKGKPKVLNYLENDENVIVVHCNAGKGRTGTIIACFLMFSGLAQTS